MKAQILRLMSIFILFSLYLFPPTALGAPSPFEGKVITIVVGHAAGGGYDLIARLLARHLPKHIPGKPTVIVENMPGAASMIAANHVYGKAQPDGLTLLATARGIAFMQLLHVNGVRYDVPKFSWIGSAASESNVLMVRSDLPYKTFDELRKSNKQIFLGGAGPADINTQTSKLSMDYLGLNVKLVDYRSTTEVWLAIERKELDGMWNAYNSAINYIKRGLVRPLARTWVSQKGIEHLPVNIDLATDPTGKTIMTMMGKTGLMGRIYLAPPGTPAPIVNILRDAFANTLKDPELQSEAQKSSFDLSYYPAGECLKLVDYMFSQPPEIIKVLDKYMKF